MSLWPLRMSRLEELVPHRIISCRRKVHSGTEVGVKVSYFRKIYHSSPDCALVMTCSLSNAQWPYTRSLWSRWRKTRSRIAAPTLPEVDGGFHFTVVHERVYWDLKDLFLWKGLETSKTSLMYPWPLDMVLPNPPQNQNVHFATEVLKHPGFTPANLQSFTDCSWRMTSPIGCWSWTKRGSEDEGRGEGEEISTKMTKRFSEEGGGCWTTRWKRAWIVGDTE